MEHPPTTPYHEACGQLRSLHDGMQRIRKMLDVSVEEQPKAVAWVREYIAIRLPQVPEEFLIEGEINDDVFDHF